MTKNSKLVLADAVVVIDAHENGYWETLCHAHQIYLPATVLHNELFHFESDRGKKALNPSTWIKEGKVVCLEGEVSGYKAVEKKLSSDFLVSLDPGELEALAILFSSQHQHLIFTTADKAAVKALGVLGMSTRGISVEELLAGSSMQKAKLPHHFTKKWFQRNLAEGFSEQHLWLRKV